MAHSFVGSNPPSFGEEAMAHSFVGSNPPSFGKEAMAHSFVGSNPPPFEIHDDRPRFDGWPE